MKENPKSTASSKRELARIVGLGTLFLVGHLCACSTAKPYTSVENKTENSSLEAPTSASQSDYARTPSSVPAKKESPSKSADSVQPWLVLKSIGFFYNRADLAGWEAIKITEIVTYVTLHPSAELGINRPPAAADVDPVTDDLNHQRVRTIINGLIAAGVSKDRIQVGNYRDMPLSLDQQVEVFVRSRL